MDRSNIEKIAHTPDDRLLLAKLWEKINAGIRRNIPASTCFLSPRELEMARYLFGEEPGLYAFGGYGDAERKMLIFLPISLKNIDNYFNQNMSIVAEVQKMHTMSLVSMLVDLDVHLKL